ncbi:hypothetical protein IQ216_02230 [Cyanobium sp. LEGE 06143]|nr:hypothetical protein [Cyanobium sp. LEGE 06143]
MEEILQEHGASVGRECWDEALQLSLDSGRIERWLAPESRYREGLRAQLGAAGAAAALETMATLLRQNLGRPLPQTLSHTLLLVEAPQGV